MGGLIYMEHNGCESIIRDCIRDLWVTMVGWVDVPYSDWGDFRQSRAVDISSLFMKCILYTNGNTLIYISGLFA